MDQRPEFALIDWIRSRVVDRGCVELGIGDDAAVLRSPADRGLLVATDMIMEGTDFTLDLATPYQVGRKALAVNLSDIAAMGGSPTTAFVSVALPKSRGSVFARQVLEGVLDLADHFDVVLAGGDTNSWDGPLVINVAVTGEPIGPKAVTRSGARAGDWLFVTGELGGSLSGHHLTFEPRVREAKRLVDLVNLHAMIDISDGLAADLHHILDQSQVGAVVDAATIPISRAARQCYDERAPLQHALADGEDFELLFAVSSDDGKQLAAKWKGEPGVTHVGQLVAEPGCWLRHADGTTDPLPPLGWTHSLAD